MQFLCGASLVRARFPYDEPRQVLDEASSRELVSHALFLAFTSFWRPLSQRRACVSVLSQVAVGITASIVPSASETCVSTFLLDGEGASDLEASAARGVPRAATPVFRVASAAWNTPRFLEPA